jgi:hypothetical protein
MHTHIHILPKSQSRVCVCVCVWERERESTNPVIKWNGDLEYTDAYKKATDTSLELEEKETREQYSKYLAQLLKELEHFTWYSLEQGGEKKLKSNMNAAALLTC